MREILLDKNIIYVLMGGAAACGIISKLVVSATLKRLVRAAGNMNKSTHPLMRLVRAKFEHACMISETVENVRVFVDKYLYEYRVAGIRFHTLRRLERASAGACLVLGIVGAALSYSLYGMQDDVLKLGAAGAALAILVYLVHLTTDENYRFEAVRNYMVDYLENVCLHRYEKTYQKELKVMAPEAPIPDFGKISDAAGQEVEEEPEAEKETAPTDQEMAKAPHGRRSSEGQKNTQEPVRPRPGKEVPSPGDSPEITPPAMPEPYDLPDVAPPVLNMKKSQEGKKERPKDVDKDVLIRQILEEFMA